MPGHGPDGPALSAVVELPAIVRLAAAAAVIAGVVWVRMVATRPARSGVLVDDPSRREPPEAARHDPPTRRAGAGDAPLCQRDVPVAVLPGTRRVLLGDLWSPPPGVPPSGTAIVYLHGSAWYVLDKDLGTRHLFRQLTRQGHRVLDVAYRLYPETDITGMIQDALRAVASLRPHAPGDDHPTELVLAGGSAGAHLALLAAYAGHDERFRPPELSSREVEVQGVVSMYGPADLAAMYDHTRQHRLPVEPPPASLDGPVPGWARRPFGPRAERLGIERMEVAGRLDWLVGGRPGSTPERYAWLSPIEHVHERCPPTLLVHGMHDTMAPVEATERLHQRLVSNGVPVSALFLPHTDHGFDLVLPRWSPAARRALQELQRFLAAIRSARQVAG